LAALDEALIRVAAAGPFDLAIYLAGADPFTEDRLGRLALTKTGLLARDERVLDWCVQNQLPVAIVMAGGYAPRTTDIVDIHAGTVRLASNHFKASRQQL
ncbi:MAG: hypothetical protein MI861_22330, partial [Pirellulales bacterium]|nr:hypothetical protein [Pirellulales bacterium]